MSRRFASLRAGGLALILAAVTAWAASPLGAQTLAVRGGTVHTLTGEPFVGTVVATDGVITAVGPDVQVPQGATVIDATGKQVYPGLFDAGTQLGLTEIGAVDVTQDSRELGLFNPQLQTMTAIHPASEHIPVARANGITHTLAVPGTSPGGIAGQASLVNLDGWTVEEMMIAPGAAMMMVWPSKGGGFGRFRGFGGGGGNPAERERMYKEAVDRYTTWMEAARHYESAYTGGPVGRDLKLEALDRVVDGDMPLLVQVNNADEIRDAVEWADAQNVKIVIAGGEEADQVVDLLVEKGVGVILGPTQSLPRERDADYDSRYRLPARLQAAGVKIAFATYNSSDSRVLPYEAGQAMAFGLPREEALRAITVNAADMLGFGDRLGTLESGKLANLIVTDGDPLEIQTQVEHLVIGGHEASTDNKHLDLYMKYRARPHPGGN